MKFWKAIGGAALTLAAYCGPSTVTPSHAASFALYEFKQLNYDAYNNPYWTGYYQLVNNTDDLKVIGFEVTNPFAGYVDPNSALTTVPLAFVGGADWEATYSTTGDFGLGLTFFSEPTFYYYAADQDSALGNGSWAGFSWGPEVQYASSVVVSYININDSTDGEGNRPIYFSEQFGAIDTPLPATLPLMGSVLGGGLVIGRWRKRRRAARAAA